MESSKSKIQSRKKQNPSTLGPNLKKIKMNDGIKVPGANNLPDEANESPKKLIRPYTRSQSKENKKKDPQGRHEEVKIDKENGLFQNMKTHDEVISTTENYDSLNRNKHKNYKSLHQEDSPSEDSRELRKLRLDDNLILEEKATSDDSHETPNQEIKWDVLTWTKDKSQAVKPNAYEKWIVDVKTIGAIRLRFVGKIEGHYTNVSLRSFYNTLLSTISFYFHNIFPNTKTESLLIEYATECDTTKFIQEEGPKKHLDNTIILSMSDKKDNKRNPISVLKVITESMDQEIKILERYFKALAKNYDFKRFSGLLISEDAVIFLRYDGTSDSPQVCKSKSFKANLNDFLEDDLSDEFKHVLKLIACMLAKSVEEFEEYNEL